MKFLVVGLLAVLLAQSALCMDGGRGSGIHAREPVLDFPDMTYQDKANLRGLDIQNGGEDVESLNAPRGDDVPDFPAVTHEDDVESLNAPRGSDVPEFPAVTYDDDSSVEQNGDDDVMNAPRASDVPEFPAVTHNGADGADEAVEEATKVDEKATKEAESSDEEAMLEKDQESGVKDPVVGSIDQLTIEGNKMTSPTVDGAEYNLVKFMANGLLKVEVIAECGDDTRTLESGKCVRDDEGMLIKNKALTFNVADADKSSAESSAIKEEQEAEITPAAEFSGEAVGDKEYRFNEVEITPVDEESFRMTLRNVGGDGEDQTRTASRISVGQEATTSTENGDITTVPITISGGDGGEWTVTLTVDPKGASSFTAEQSE